MATNQERTRAICDALVNGSSTLAQQLELAEALYGVRVTPFSSLTTAQKWAIVPTEMRDHGLLAIRKLRESKRPAIVDPSNDFPVAQ